MRFTTIAIFTLVGGLFIGVVIYGMRQLEEKMSEINEPLPSISAHNSQVAAKQKAVVVNVNETATRERAIRDAQEQARQSSYRAEAEHATYQAQVPQATYQAELQAQQAVYQAQQAAYQAQQAMYQAQQAVTQAQALRGAPPAAANTKTQSDFGSGDATYHVINGLRYKVPGK